MLLKPQPACHGRFLENPPAPATFSVLTNQMKTDGLQPFWSLQQSNVLYARAKFRSEGHVDHYFAVGVSAMRGLLQILLG